MTRSFRRLLWWLIFSFLLFALDSLGWLRPVKAWVEQGSNPLKAGVYRTVRRSVDWLPKIRVSQKELIKWQEKTEEFERENAALKSQLTALLSENASMRRLLQAPLPPEWDFLPATVIGQTRYLSIDKGERDGVKEGMVAVFENVLVGRVIEASERSAKIILPTDENSKISVKVGGVRGSLLGDAEDLILTEIPQGERFEAGDLVTTSGEKEIFPPKLLLGKVKEISKEEREVYQRAQVEPLLDYAKLETVFIIVD